MSVETISQLFLNTVTSYPKDDLMMFKRAGAFVNLSSREVLDRVKNTALGLRSLGIGPGDKVVILSENRPEWTMTDFAALCLGAVVVPIYTTLMPDQIKYIVDDSDAKIVVTSNRELWPKVAAVRGELAKVAHYVAFDPEGIDGAMPLAELMDRGRSYAASRGDEFEALARAVKPGDLASIIYTSGTTGVPKGVMLTHANFVSNIVSLRSIVDFTDKDPILSFLPLSHVLERMGTFAFLYTGAHHRLRREHRDRGREPDRGPADHHGQRPAPLREDLRQGHGPGPGGPGLQEEDLLLGPRGGEEARGEAPARRARPGFLAFQHKLARKLVFSKIIAKTGGRIRFFVSGGAPLSKDIAEFFYALGLTVIEGYGLTETSPVLTGNTSRGSGSGPSASPSPASRSASPPTARSWPAARTS